MATFLGLPQALYVDPMMAAKAILTVPDITAVEENLAALADQQESLFAAPFDNLQVGLSEGDWGRILEARHDFVVPLLLMPPEKWRVSIKQLEKGGSIDRTDLVLTLPNGSFGEVLKNYREALLLKEAGDFSAAGFKFLAAMQKIGKPAEAHLALDHLNMASVGIFLLGIFHEAIADCMKEERGYDDDVIQQYKIAFDYFCALDVPGGMDRLLEKSLANEREREKIRRRLERNL